MNTKMTYAPLLFVAIIILAFFCVSPSLTPHTNATDNATFGEIVVDSSFPESCIIDFVSPVPIAPNYRIDYYQSSSYEIYLYDSQQWDPKSIGVDSPMRLTGRVMDEVSGIETVYAKRYTLTVIIAKSHLTRKNEIIEHILVIMNEHLNSQA